MTNEDKLAAALERADALIQSAQTILARHLEPESGQGEKETIIALAALLDGPEQRRIQKATSESLEAYRG